MPSPAQAKAAWDTHANPSLNNVLAVLHAAGFTGMTKSTLQRWRANNWPERKISKPEDFAAAKEVTKKVVEAEEATATADEAEAKALAGTALAVLAETATRESLTALILLARRIQRHADMLVRAAPKEAAKLIEALKGPSSNVTLVMPGGVEQSAEPKTVGGNVIEHDAGDRPMTPLQQSIREFRSQQLKVVR